MVDPVALARQTEELVARGEQRRYSRFRAARFYGGIATADCVGCCLRCAFCWGWRTVTDPAGGGSLVGPDQVVARVVSIARKHGFRQARLSGNEPTLARAHLLAVLARLPGDIHFILETNGILLGHEPGYARALGAIPNLHVRVSLKGCTPEGFARVTGADPAAFELPLRALERLLEAGVPCHAAVVVSLARAAEVQSVRQRLRRIDPHLADFEAEELFLNPAIERRLAAALGGRESTRPPRAG